jgi:hypothetical protein
MTSLSFSVISQFLPCLLWSVKDLSDFSTAIALLSPRVLRIQSSFSYVESVVLADQRNLETVPTDTTQTRLVTVKVANRRACSAGATTASSQPAVLRVNGEVLMNGLNYHGAYADG